MLARLSTLLFDEKYKNKTWGILCVIAMLSLYIGLIFPFRGEEGLYPDSSFDMLFNHNYTNVFAGGGYYGRPPMFNWLMLGVAHVIGYQHMLIAARFVTITLTILTACMLFWFAKTLTKNQTFSLFSVLCYLSGDILFRSSWIAYADPTFAFFTFTAICFMWIGCDKNKQSWLLPAVLALIGASLSKALTCYAFYGVTALVLLFQQKKWRFFFNPISIALHLFALSFPFIWFKFVAHHTDHRALWDLFHNFTGQHAFHFGRYFSHQLNTNLTYLLRFAPISLLVFYALITKKFQKPATGYPDWIKAASFSVLINFLPYALTPGVYQIRYLLPIAPLIALLFAFVLTYTTDKLFKISLSTLVFFIAMKMVLSPFGLPWFEHMSYRYDTVTNQIIQLSKGYPLYAGDIDTIFGMLDEKRYPKPPVTNPPTDSKKGFFLVAATPRKGNYKLIKSYHITNNSFNLYCYNSACNEKRIRKLL